MLSIVAKGLGEVGFRRKGNSFYHQVDSSDSRNRRCRTSISVNQCQWRKRLGFLFPNPSDTWWRIDTKTSSTAIGERGPLPQFARLFRKAGSRHLVGWRLGVLFTVLPNRDIRGMLRSVYCGHRADSFGRPRPARCIPRQNSRSCETPPRRSVSSKITPAGPSPNPSSPAKTPAESRRQPERVTPSQEYLAVHVASCFVREVRIVMNCGFSY
jgi:hypothetical protein